MTVLALGLLLARTVNDNAAFAQENLPAAAANPLPNATDQIDPNVPLYKQAPFDLITLTSNHMGRVLKVEPLYFSGRRWNKHQLYSGKLQVRLWKDPETIYELDWKAVEKVDLFEQLILQKAVELNREGKSEEAFDYFSYLESTHPKLPTLAAAVEDYLYNEAARRQTRRQLRSALAVLNELYRRNPRYPNLENALAAITDELVMRYVNRKDYASARTLLAALAKRFPDHDTVLQWNERIKAEAELLLQKCREAFQAGKLREASRTSRKITAIWPNLSGADELLAAINKQYPRVVVGVNMPVDISRLEKQYGHCNGRLDCDLATRRSSRLLQRTLSEYLGPGAEGGVYRCGVGDMTIQELQHRISFRILPDIHWSKSVANMKSAVSPQRASTLSGADVARRLLAMVDPSEDCYDRSWAELLQSVSVDDVYGLEVQLSRPHVRPDALLQTVLPPYTAARLQATALNLGNGPYEIIENDKKQTVYTLNKNYFAAEAAQPREIVERHFENQREAVRALRDGQIMLIDRVTPWDLSSVRSIDGVIVRPYAAATVHCLVPNMSRPLTARREFRRSLVYGINRQAILDHLLGGENPGGCSVISGPFIRGESLNDPLGYAYDTSIEPRPYEPHLAIALAKAAIDMTAAEAKEAVGKNNGQPQTTNANAVIARLVLAHQPDETARVACSHIKRQLRLVGIEITLRQLNAAVNITPEDVDLLYAELPMWEPLVDAAKLLDRNGPARDASPYMNLALRQLQQATDWRQVRAELRKIHRIAHNDVAVIPLWQMKNHFAHRHGLSGLGERPVLLYQNVESWRLETQ